MLLHSTQLRFAAQHISEILQVSVHQWCRIRVTVLETTRDQDNGTKITLSGIIVMSTAAFDFAKERSWLAPATFLDKVV